MPFALYNSSDLNMHNATYISYDAAADYNAKFIKKDANGLDATNQGWCHRFAPFRAFICDPMVIQCLRYFKKTRCKYGYIDFDNNFLQRYFGNNYWQDEWCQACCNFITTLVQNTDRYGRLVEKKGYGCLKRTGNDLNTLRNLTSYTLNKDIYESVGNTLEYKYATNINEMCCFLSAVLSILISNSVRYEANSDKDTYVSKVNRSFYDAANHYNFTRFPIIHYGNHFFNSCRINNQYTFAGYDNKEPYHYTHKDLVKKYINSFWPIDATGKKIPEQEPSLTMFVPKITARGKEMCDYSHAVPTQAGNQYQHNITNAKRNQWEIIRANETWDKGIKKLKFHQGRYAAAWQAFQKNWYSYNYFGALKAQQICNQAAIDFDDKLHSLQTLTFLNPCLNNRVNQAFWIAPNGNWILK